MSIESSSAPDQPPPRGRRGAAARGDPALVAAVQGLGRHDGRALGRGLRTQGPAAGASGT